MIPLTPWFPFSPLVFIFPPMDPFEFAALVVEQSWTDG